MTKLRAEDGQAKRPKAWGRRSRNTDRRVVPAQGALPDAQGIIQQVGSFLIFILVPGEGQKYQGVTVNSAHKPTPSLLSFGMSEIHLGIGPTMKRQEAPREQ